MRPVAFLLILLISVTNAIAGAHAYGMIPDSKPVSQNAAMPCCPSPPTKSASLSCHYCCVAPLAVPIGAHAVINTSARVTFIAEGDVELLGRVNNPLLKPPRSLL